MSDEDSTNVVPLGLGGFRDRLAQFTQATGWLLCVLTLLTLTARHWWFGDLLANLRIQLAIAILLTAVIQTCLYLRKSAIVQLLLIGLHLPWLASGLPTGSVDEGSIESPPEKSLVVTTANVYSGNRRYGDIEAELLRCDSDIVAIVELSSGLAAHLSGDFRGHYPHALIEPQDRGNFGIGVYSKFPFETSSVLNFGSESIPSVAASVVCKGKRIHVLATHTLPPMGASAFEHRNGHIRKVVEHVERHRQLEPETPVVVVGDLNLTPWSPVYHDFLKSADLTSAGTGRGWTPTWYRYPVFPFGLVLDHLLMTEGLTCLSYDVSDDVGSDHRFVTSTLTW